MQIINSSTKIRIAGFFIALAIAGLALSIWKGFLGGPPSFSELTIAGELRDNIIFIEGTTDLPDNTLIRISVAKKDIGLPIVEGTPKVSGGRYETAFARSLAAGTYIVTAFLTANDQDAKVLKKIGEYGENLAGKDSYKGAHIFSDYTFIRTQSEFTVGP